MTASPYDAPLSALREHVENLAAWLAVWEHRAEPDAHARRCASDAVATIDAMLSQLYLIRERLISETCRADDDMLARPKTQGSDRSPGPETRGRDPAPERKITITMHTIEFDGAAPAPWKITTDDGAEWDAASEIEAAVELAEYIIERDQQAQPAVPALPEGAFLV